MAWGRKLSIVVLVLGLAGPSWAQGPAQPALTSAEEIAWKLIKDTTDLNQLAAFLSQFPDSSHRAEAQARIAALAGAEEIAWKLIKDTTDLNQLAAFLAQFPNSSHRPEAQARIATLSQRSGKISPSGQGDTAFGSNGATAREEPKLNSSPPAAAASVGPPKATEPPRVEHRSAEPTTPSNLPKRTREHTAERPRAERDPNANTGVCPSLKGLADTPGIRGLLGC